MSASRRQFTTKELSKRTWPDFERLFSQGNGWDHCWCTAYQGGNRGTAKRAERSRVNRQFKKQLVDSGRAHGILVYALGEPVGWCQFGPEDELPVKDPDAPLGGGPARRWRITCFVTHKAWRHQGVARTALKAALATIRKKGGGVVEAYPFAHAEQPAVDPEVAAAFAEIAREHGRNSEIAKTSWITRSGGVTYAMGKPLLVQTEVEGVGPVDALCRWWGPAFHVGTAAMFEDEGFRAVGTVPPKRRAGPAQTDADLASRYDVTRLVMQRTV